MKSRCLYTQMLRLVPRALIPLALTIHASCMSGEYSSETTRVRGTPNVLVILADDAGYADFGFQGSADAVTPNIDSIARNGATYSSAYVTMPFCSPSRAGLLSGRYTQRFGYEFNLTHESPPGVDAEYMGLAVEESTIADYMKAAGYVTVAIGKWHVGDAQQFHPNARGFDHFYGFLGGGGSYHPALQKSGVGMTRNRNPVQPSEYLTDDFAREAVTYIKALKDQPFFMYLAFNAVHTPMDVLTQDIQRFAHIEDEQRQRLMAMTWAMDRAVGRVMASLADNGLLGNTLVIFTNDNGGDRIGIGADNAPLRGTKGTLLEGGVRVPFAMQWPGVIPTGADFDGIISLMDIMPTAITVAGASLPENLDGRPLLTEAGILVGGHDSLFWRYDAMAAVRDGDWKLLRYPDRTPELYNLSSDVGEKDNLASQQPDRANRLLTEIFAWEAGLIHARWNTGTYWSQEDVRRYDDTYVAQRQAETARDLSGAVR